MEVIVTLGSKEGLANLASAITTPGDVILVPNPSYPIHQFGFTIAGAAVRNIPVGLNSDFIEALERAVQHSVPKPAALVLNRITRLQRLLALIFMRQWLISVNFMGSIFFLTWPILRSILILLHHRQFFSFVKLGK